MGKVVPAVGDTLRIEVSVCSIKKVFPLDVQLLSVRELEDGRNQLMVSFLPATPSDELLDAAWADGCDSPQRRSRRQPLQLSVRYERLDGQQMEPRTGRLVNLSSGGCCVEGSALPPPGTQVLLIASPAGDPEGTAVRMVGKVRWTERPEGGMMGVEFVGPPPETGSLLGPAPSRRG